MIYLSPPQWKQQAAKSRGEKLRTQGDWNTGPHASFPGYSLHCGFCVRVGKEMEVCHGGGRGKNRSVSREGGLGVVGAQEGEAEDGIQTS